MFHRSSSQAHLNGHSEPVARGRGRFVDSTEATLPPVERTVELLSAIGRGGREDFLTLRSAVTTSEAARSEALRAICEHPSLMERPTKRAALLEALAPFSTEPLVREFAVVTLESPYLKNSQRAVSGASRLLAAALSGANAGGGEPLSAALEGRLLKVASRYSPGGGDLAAGAALHLLPFTTIPQDEPYRIHSLARAWFVERHQEKNPWLALLATRPSVQNAKFIGNIATGNVPKSEAAGLLKTLSMMPLTIHHVAITTTVATVVTRQICAYLNIPKALSNATVAVLSAVLVVGGEALSRAYQADTLNSNRDWERVEAIARLASMRATLCDSPLVKDQRLVNKISALLTGSSMSLLQSPLVRDAARIALASEPLDPIDLWNLTLKSGEYNTVERRYLPDIRA